MNKITIEQLVAAEYKLKEAVEEIKTGVVALIMDSAGTKPGVVPYAPVSLTKDSFTENDGWGDTVTFDSKMHQGVISDEVIICGGRSGILNHKSDFPFVAEFKNLTLLQGKYATGWGIQLNKARGNIVGCTFVRLGDPSLTQTPETKFKDGHPLYIKPDGVLNLVGNKFIDCQGNVQFAARPWEGDIPDSISLDIKDNVFNNCSHSPFGHGGGGATNLAIYCGSKSGTEVSIVNNIVHNTIVYDGASEAKNGPASRGFVTVFNEAWYPDKKRQDEGFAPDSSLFFDRVYIANNTIHTEATDRPLIDIKGAKEVIIEGNFIAKLGQFQDFIYPIIRIDSDPGNPVKAEKVYIEPIDAPGEIQVGEVRLPLSVGYQHG